MPSRLQKINQNISEESRRELKAFTQQMISDDEVFILQIQQINSLSWQKWRGNDWQDRKSEVRQALQNEFAEFHKAGRAIVTTMETGLSGRVWKIVQRG